MKRIALFAAALLLAAPVHAATFSVGDLSAPGGDFANANSPSMFNIGTATAGTSEAFGNLNGECDSFDCNGVGPDSQDSFFITIADGFKLTEVGGQNEGFGPAGMQIRYSISLYPVNSASLFNAPQSVNTSGTLWTGELGAGTYAFSVYGASTQEAGTFDLYWNAVFTVEADTPAVPLPAGLPLLAAGLGALGLASRRRKG